MKWIPHNYQETCIRKGEIENAFAFFLDPGLGKTSICLELFRRLKRKGRVKGALIVAPLRPCYMVWPNEIQKWDNFKQFTYTVLHSEWSGKKETNLRRAFDFYIINPEGLDWLLKQGHFPFDMLIVDESTRFQNPSAKCFKILRKMLSLFKRRYILTGTPIPNRYESLYGQIYLLDQGKRLGKNRTVFRDRYFKPFGRPEWYQYEIRKEKIADLQNNIKDISIRLEAKDFLKLPDKLDIKIEVLLDPRARKTYNEMEYQLATEIKNIELLAFSESSAYSKCHQIANGAVYVDDSYSVIHDHKINALKDLVEELQGKPLLVAYNFKHDLERLKKAFKNFEYIGRGVSIKECQALEKKWNSGKINLLGAYPGSAALGLNLQEQGENICFFSLLDHNEYYDQFIKRLLRQGSKAKKIRVHHIIAKNTVDEIIYKRLQTKETNQRNFLKSLKTYLGEKKW